MKSTKNIKVPEKIINQVIGQEAAVKIIRKAASQRRHVLLIGEPGTGKSMLGLALSELLPRSELKDVISFPNPDDENEPLIKTVPAGTGKTEVRKIQLDSKEAFKNHRFLYFFLAILVMIAPWWARHHYKSDVMFAAFFLGGMMFMVALSMMMNLGPRMMGGAMKVITPKLIIDKSDKKKGSFYEATGAHAGALLGDVLHDPLQCFLPELEIQKITDGKMDSVALNQELDPLFNKHKDRIIKKDKRNYEALFLPKNASIIMGETDNSVSPVEILSSNRHDYNGEMIKLTTSENKKLVVTPEHRVAIWKNDRIIYVEAKNIKEGDKVMTKTDDIIINEQDIINTYDVRQQEQCRLYYQYLKIKQQNPTWGYKRISKSMNQPIGKTRWWHAKKHIPVPIQTTNWLKERGLLPLKMNHPQLPLISKILGSSFGDGGIFSNLNAIFLSSSELEATEEFGENLKEIFGELVHQNSRIIEGGIEGHSWCYQNTNRNIIRFFQALEAPIGKKTGIKFRVPNWIYLTPDFQDEFFGSLLGSELGVPKVHKQKNRLDMLSLGITGDNKTIQSKIDFLYELKKYLESKGIESTSINKRDGKTKGTTLCRLMISIKFDNVVRFFKNTKINYCTYKQEKLIKTINEFRIIKKNKYNELIERGYGAEHAMKVLHLTPESLYRILNDEEITA